MSVCLSPHTNAATQSTRPAPPFAEREPTTTKRHNTQDNQHSSPKNPQLSHYITKSFPLIILPDTRIPPHQNLLHLLSFPLQHQSLLIRQMQQANKTVARADVL